VILFLLRVGLLFLLWLLVNIEYESGSEIEIKKIEF